jgi:cell filamentation protein
MALDKYGTGDDPYCYPNSSILVNLLDIKKDEDLNEAEASFTKLALEEIEFESANYDLNYLQDIHCKLFKEIYEWAGEIRTIDLSKGSTRFCICSRIDPEAAKIFSVMEDAN